MKWSRACAGLTTVDHPSQQRGEPAEAYRRQLGLYADPVHDGGNINQFWNVAPERRLIYRHDQPNVRVTVAPIGWKHLRCITNPLGEKQLIEVWCPAN